MSSTTANQTLPKVVSTPAQSASAGHRAPTTHREPGGVTVLAADLNADGKQYAVTIDYKFGVLQLTMIAALGKLTPNDGIFPFTLSPGLSEMAVGDSNGDGIQDVTVTDFQTNQVNSLLGLAVIT